MCMASGETHPQIDSLRQLLAADFRPEETQQAQLSATSGSLAWLLAHTVDAEDVEARLMSEENRLLGEEVMHNLVGAVITVSFKSFIVNTMRQAHASEARVSKEVAAVNLGLNDENGGIFNAVQAPIIEAGFLRVRLYNIINQYVITGVAENDQPTRVVLHAQNYIDEMMVLEQWIAEYVEVHGKNPFEDVDMDAYMLATQEVQVIPPKSEEGQRLGELLQRLEELRQQKDSDT